ncbi:MAG: formate dehydrogenase accessory sulfurtransferase FdhD [Verrucomicrobia bacterium]|nr:formate dehydrogenase accessory sulfurtransferase FdhD [Verrucomicrobiota bacterium]
MENRVTNARRYENGVLKDCQDALTTELPLQIKINGKPFSVTMRTPGADEDLVRGLLFTEEIVLPGHAACTFREERETADVHTIDVTIPPLYLCPNVHEKRTLLASAACGLCGQREFDAPGLSTRPLVPSGKLPLARVQSLIAAMRAEQHTFAATGSTHAAALFRLDGSLLAAAEDIGRHNAVDKVVGNLLKRDQLRDAQVLAVSGRISFEIVSKAYRAGIPFLLAVSAPSSFAVDMCQRWGMTIIGYCRDTRCTVYAHPEQVA